LIDWNSAERFSCSGALHLHAGFSERGQGVYSLASAPTGTFWDWSKRKRLHLWVRLGAPGVGQLEQLVDVITVVSAHDSNLQSEGRYFGRIADASWLRDFAWHELLFELNDQARENVDGYGIQVSLLDPLPDGAPTTLPEIDLYVDDVWLE